MLKFGAWVSWRGDGVAERNSARGTTQSSSTMPKKLLQEGALEHPLGSLPLKSGVAWDGAVDVVVAVACPTLTGVRALAVDVVLSLPSPQGFTPTYSRQREENFFFPQGILWKGLWKTWCPSEVSDLAPRAGRVITYLCPPAPQGCLKHLKAEVVGIFLWVEQNLWSADTACRCTPTDYVQLAQWRLTSRYYCN